MSIVPTYATDSHVCAQCPLYHYFSYTGPLGVTDRDATVVLKYCTGKYYFILQYYLGDRDSGGVTTVRDFSEKTFFGKILIYTRGLLYSISPKKHFLEKFQICTRELILTYPLGVTNRDDTVVLKYCIDKYYFMLQYYLGVRDNSSVTTVSDFAEEKTLPGKSLIYTPLESLSVTILQYSNTVPVSITSYYSIIQVIDSIYWTSNEAS